MEYGFTLLVLYLAGVLVLLGAWASIDADSAALADWTTFALVVAFIAFWPISVFFAHFLRRR